MSKVIVIGAGASGIISALVASKNNEVVLLDGNDKCGKKLLLTGNGRCNYWNSDISLEKYNTDDEGTLREILSEENKKDTLTLLESLGIYPKIKGEYYYPYSNQAFSVREILERAIKRNNIEFKPGFKVKNIKKDGNKFVVISENNESISGDKVIIASGGKSYPKTGSDGSGYVLASKLGHKINDVVPALTQLLAKESFLKDWENIRCDAIVSLYINNKKVKEDIGEIQLTKTGISGICTFNISGLASKHIQKGEKVEVSIDFLPNIDFYSWFEDRNKLIKHMNIEEQLESIFNYKLMFILLKQSGISKESKWLELSEDEKRSLCKQIEDFRLTICGVEGFDKAQVSSGGISLSDVNPSTMESKILSGLFFAGEILDVDGRCGGFNLAFAWISGYIAGRGI